MITAEVLAAETAVVRLKGALFRKLMVLGTDYYRENKAGDIIKSIAPIVGGKGGGKPDSAMGGGSDASKVNDALAAVKPFVGNIVG